MKKIGYFFSGFLPILTTTAAQILASFFMFGIAALFLCPASQSTGFDADTIETLLTNTEFNACIMLIYTVTCIVFMGIWYLSLLWGQLSSKTIPHVSSSAVFIHHSSDSRHAVLFRLSDFCGISSFPELAQPVRKTHGNRRLRLRHRTVHVYLCRNSRSCL